jgi:hypothetical protein
VLEPFQCVYIHIKMNLESYYSLIRCINEENIEGKFVKEKDVKRWFAANLYGKVTKEKLDDKRAEEFNDNDMMSNTSFSYHPESIYEMQFFCTILVW